MPVTCSLQTNLNSAAASTFHPRSTVIIFPFRVFPPLSPSEDANWSPAATEPVGSSGKRWKNIQNLYTSSQHVVELQHIVWEVFFCAYTDHISSRVLSAFALLLKCGKQPFSWLLPFTWHISATRQGFTRNLIPGEWWGSVAFMGSGGGGA